MKKINLNRQYLDLVNSLKVKIREAQHKAILSVNKELTILYWEIGRMVLERQQAAGWGAKIINKLSKDLSISFPEMKGFSVRNLKYMQKFAKNYRDRKFVQQAAAQIPWFHNCRVCIKGHDKTDRCK